MAANYTYKTHTYGGVKLHIIETKASNIKLVNTAQDGSANTLASSNNYGINGAFFVMSGNDEQHRNMVLNIAYYNGVCMKTGGINKGDAFKNDIGRGVVGWDGTHVRYHENIKSADAKALSYIDGKNTWAQGGVALWLGTKHWKDKFIEQNAGQYVDKDANPALRTAMICDLGTSNKVYLIITTNATTVEKFRAAIEDLFDINDDSGLISEDFQGIMLDGGGSTQMSCANFEYTSTRPIPEIVALKSKS